MIKINRSMVGGVAVAGLLLSNTLVLANPTVTAKPNIISIRLQAQLTEVHDRVSDQRFQVFSLGQPGWEKQVVANAKEIDPPAMVKVAQSQASSLKAGTKVQVASRGAAPKVTKPAGPPANSGIVPYALSLQGIPYKFGGTTTSGFDCSGFTQYVFRKFGISIPRTSYEQAQFGNPVAKSDLLPGDLVFFSTYAKGASHAGIYIGGGKFVEASPSKGITVTGINDSYYASRFVGARRVSK